MIGDGADLHGPSAGTATGLGPKQQGGSLRANTVWNALGQGLPVLGVVVLTPLLVTHLGLDRYGLFVLLSVLTSFFSSFDGGLSASASRFFSIQAGAGDRVTSAKLFGTVAAIMLVASAVLTALVHWVAPVCVNLVGTPSDIHDDAVFVVRSLGGVVGVLLLAGLLTSLVNAQRRYLVTTATSAASYLVFFIMTVLLLENGYGIRALVRLLVLQSALRAILLIPSAMRAIEVSELGLLPWPEVRSFVAFASRIQLVGLSGVITLEADSFIVGFFRSIASVGVYNTGANFSSQLRSLAVTALSPIATDLGTKFGARGWSAAADFERLQRRWVQFVCGWCAVGASASYFGISAWLGGQFRDAAAVAVVLLIGNGVNLLTGVLTVWLQVTGYPEIEARYALMGVALNIVLTCALIGPFGLLGIAAATAVGQGVSSLYLLRLVKHGVERNVRSFLGDIPWVRCITVSGVTVAAESAVSGQLPHGALGLVASGLVAAPGLAVYAYSILVLEKSVRRLGWQG